MIDLSKPDNIMSYLSTHNVSIRLENNRLLARGRLTPEIRSLIKDKNNVIINFLSKNYTHFENYLANHPTSTYVYDTEVYPNFFSLIAMNIEDNLDIHKFEISERKNDRDLILLFLNRDITLAGFNNANYDDMILRGILYRKNLYNLSQSIIVYKQIDYNLKYKPVRFKSIDLQKIGGFYFALKQVAIKLNFPNVEDLPLDPNQPVPLDKIDTLLKYNLNDVKVTFELYHYLLSAIRFREDYSKKYGLDLMVSDSQIGERILKNFYKDRANLSENDFKYMGTNRKTIHAVDCLTTSLNFSSEKLSETFKEVKSWELSYKSRFKKYKKIEFGGLKLKIGVGGLHSTDTGGIFNSSDNNQITFIDVSSYYPNLIRTKNIYPCHLNPEIISEIYSELITQRLKLKSEGDKLGSSLLKLALNAIYGQSNYGYSWLYDPQVFVTVTLYGQFLLLSLIETLISNEIEVLTVNTDGLIVNLDPGQITEFNRLCKVWQQQYDLHLEYIDIDQYIRKDCNNFMLIKEGEIIKRTGIFQDIYDDIQRDSSCQIIKKSLVTHFHKGVDPEEFIRSSTDIFDFILTKNINKKFALQYGDKVLSRHSRFIASPEGEFLHKFEISNPDRKIAMWKNQKVLEVNRIKDLSHYQLDYDFYISEVNKILDKIYDNKVIKPDLYKNCFFSSKNDKWDTPKDLINDLSKVFKWDLDVCASYPNVCENFFSEKEDGLKQTWRGLCWMNPPYGRSIGKWVIKARSEKATVICLLPARVDTKWWNDNIKYASLIVFIKGRLKFGGSKINAPFPSAFLVFGKINKEQKEVLSSYGFTIEQNID